MKRSAVYLSVAVAACVFHLLYAPDVLWSWDALQFALGLDRFDMAMHRPHPPGYIGHMALGWIIRWITGLSPDTAIQAASIVFSGATAAAVLALGRQLGSWGVGAAAAFFFVTNPLSAFSAVSGDAYPAQALGAVLLVTAGLRVKRDSTPARVASFFLLYGLLGGIRQDIPLFFLPFATWRLVLACKGRARPTMFRLVSSAFAASVAGTASWAVPLVILAGGPDRLASSFGTQFFGVFGAFYSPLMGASQAAVMTNLNRAWRFLLAASCAAGPAWVLLKIAARGRGTTGHRGLWAAWMLPPVAWFVGMYMYKPEYASLLVPAFSLGCALALTKLPGPWSRAFVAVAVSTVQLALFAAPPPWWSGGLAGRSLPVLDYKTAVLQASLHSIRERAGGNPQSVLVVTRDGAFHFREAMYYLPWYRVLWLRDSESTGAPIAGVDSCEAVRRRVACSSGLPLSRISPFPESVSIPLGPEVKHIAWSADPGEGFIRTLVAEGLATDTNLEPVGSLWVTHVPDGPWTLDIGGYSFHKP